LGEVEKHRWYYECVKEMNVFVQQSKEWPDSFLIDIRRKEWIGFVIHKIIPSMIHYGFDGIFLDTLDSSISLEDSKKPEFKGMKEATIRFVQTIKHHFPYLKIIMNRGFEIAPTLAPLLDGILAESIYTAYNFKEKNHFMVNPEHYESIRQHLFKIQSQNKDLFLLSLDYWDIKDQEKFKDIYKFQRSKGFIPYVSVLNLQSLVHEPS
jgi:polysaccharide biosynthesis protein PelA